MRKWIAAIAAMIAVSLSTTVVAATPQNSATLQGDGGVPEFYTWERALPAKPGKLLRFEPMTEKAPLENAAQSFRILYSSTDGLDGKSRLTVSGALYTPNGKAPKGGWPLMAWAHGTVGIGDTCAPSFTGRSPRDVTYLNFWLGQGYAVVASDYQGLGTPGGHPYLATRPVAYSMLDAIRAVQGKAFGIGKKVVLVGQSQGGGGAFATAGFASSYAPEIDIRGTVATGTPYFKPESQAAIDAARPLDLVDPLIVYNFYLLSLQQQVDPAFNLENHVSARALPAARTAGDSCFLELAQRVVADGLTRRNSFIGNPSESLSKFAGVLDFQTLRIATPVFMGVGGKDRDVPPAMQLSLKADACAAGTRIEGHVYPDADHSGAVNGSTKDSSVFVKRVFSGETIAGNC